MNWWVDPNWWVQAVTALGTVGAVLVALFAEVWKRRLLPPKFHMELKSESGELTPVNIRDPQTGQVRSEQGRYYHVSVKNVGWSLAKNSAVYLTRVMLRGAGGTWYQAWSGETPLSWRLGELYPLLREIGSTPIDADLFALVRNKWLELCVVVRPNALPKDSPDDIPGRWRKKIEMVIVVQAKSTDAQSEPKLFHVDWDGGWEEGDMEILRHLRIKSISEISDV